MIGPNDKNVLADDEDLLEDEEYVDFVIEALTLKSADEYDDDEDIVDDELLILSENGY